MNAYDMVHLTIHALGGEISGKTKLQKIMYFVGVLTDSLDELGYRPHFYGPYSAEVAGAMDRLRSLEFVDQNVIGGGRVDGHGFEIVRYDYSLNKDGNQVAETKAKRYPDESQKITNAVDMLKKANEQDYFRLSIAAKTYHMLGGEKETASINELASLADKFGWSVTPEQVKRAAEFLEKLGLVTLTSAKSG